MKKIFALLAVFVCLLWTPSLCMATQSGGILDKQHKHPFPFAELSLGGILLGTSREYVDSVYGAPSTETEPAYFRPLHLKVYSAKYGDSFDIVYFIDPDTGRHYVNSMESAADNGLATPKGIKVGSPIGDVVKAYGMPFQYEKYSKDDPKYPDCLLYSYHTFQVAGVSFLFNAEKKVVKITMVDSQ